MSNGSGIHPNFTFSFFNALSIKADLISMVVASVLKDKSLTAIATILGTAKLEPDAFVLTPLWSITGICSPGIKKSTDFFPKFDPWAKSPEISDDDITRIFSKSKEAGKTLFSSMFFPSLPAETKNKISLYYDAAS